MLTLKRHLYHYLIATLILFFLFSSARAQLIADFTTDKAGGCSPLTIQLTNTTTGASANASWNWDFGNGNSSVEKNPAAAFIGVKTYAITLTVKDGDKVSVKTKSVTVYAKPEIDFSFDPPKGCMPLEVNFTARQTGGDGKVSTWTWDFGDGSTSSEVFDTTKHTYHFRQSATVSLTALSSFGCARTIVKEKIIEVKDSVRADFSADNTLFCNANATVAFTNNSAGAGTLTYKWDFGDGNTSTSTSPVHTYKRNGKFTVSLIVISSEGCSVSTVKKEYIAIGNLISDFSVPDLTCEKKELVFRNTSFPKPMKSTWYVDGNIPYIFTDSTLNFSFPSPGTHTIRLVNQFSNCVQEVSKEINIKVAPALDTFLVEQPVFCPPVTVKFADTSADAVKWKWNFHYWQGSNIVHSTDQKPSFQYSNEGTYWVNLEIENKEGCTSSVSRWIRLEYPIVHMRYTDTTGFISCSSLTKSFEAVATDSIISYLWDFGDGHTSTEARPTHSFTKPGYYEPTLLYKTIHGCIRLIESQYDIQVLTKPKVDFEVPAEVCGGDYIHINNKTTGSSGWLIMDWGDGTPLDYSGSGHRYTKPGEYTLTMVAQNYMCNDTLTKKNIIKVKGPFARIEKVEYSCEGERNTLTFVDSSTYATKWTWDFEDGTKDTYTMHKPSLTHKFENSWNYMVRLTVENDGCVQKDSVIVYILKKQKPVLSFDRDILCIGDDNSFKVRNLEQNIYILSDPNPRYILNKIEYKNGQAYTGGYAYESWTWYQDLNGILKPRDVVNDSIRMIITSYFHGCEDTTNYVPFVVKGVNTAFDIVQDNQCFRQPVVFRDRSKAIGINSIINRIWDFGDGQTLTTNKTENITHVYSHPGLYEVKLTAEDAGGCSSSITNATSPVRVKGAKAEFYVSPGLDVEERADVQFINQTNTTYATGEVKYRWMFGNGETSSNANPVYRYQSAGKYKVQLIATDQGSGCVDTFSLTVTVTDVPEQTDFNVNKAFLGDQGGCPPVLASVFFNSNLPYTKLIWDFGDGFTLEDQSGPSHMYTKPGIYIITLKVFDGTINTGTYKDTVSVGLPPALIGAGDNTLCKGDDFSLFAPFKKSGYTYTWDFGNGAVKTGTDSLVNHRYNHPGTFQPSLIVRDNAGCAAAVSLPEMVIVYPDPVITLVPASAMVCYGSGVQLTASGGVQYLWTPKAGLSADNIANPLASPVSNTLYTVTGTDNNGCRSQSAVQVTVAPPINIQAVSAIEICKGDEVRLNVTGATAYQWIGNTNGLSNTAIPNPVVRPQHTTTYTVVGTDPHNCYRDTAEITVQVRPLPTIILGQDQELATGMPVTLQSNTSADVINWEWSPSTYLNCSNCPAPVSTPFADITYVVTVTNKYQCKSSDTIMLKTLCSGNKIHIPNTFTPNGDGLNDVFRIPANGISRIGYLRIFNSWGEKIFEHTNYIPGDPAGNWSGKLKGLDLPAGTYVYITEVECSAEKKFIYKGTVTLLR